MNDREYREAVKALKKVRDSRNFGAQEKIKRLAKLDELLWELVFSLLGD